MKKVLRIVIVTVASMVPLIFSGSAFAASTCRVGYTGPDSNNMCTSVTTYACTVVNDTTVDIDNQNTQVTVAGNASAGGNGATGTVSTGSATNSNGTTFNVTVTNQGVTKTCSVVATVPATTTPTAPAQTVTPPQPVAAKTLPNTSNNETLPILGGVVALLGIGAIAARLATVAYSRLKS